MKRKSKKELPIDPAFKVLFSTAPRKGDLRKIEIIKAAIQIIGFEGIEATTFDAIAKVAGVRKSHVAYYFPDKSQIIDLAIQIIIGQGQQLIVQKMNAIESDREILKAYVHGHFELLRQNPGYGSVLMLFYHYCASDPEYNVTNKSIRQAGIERLQAISERWLRAKNLPRQSPTLNETASLHAMLQGHISFFASIFTHQSEKEKNTFVQNIIEGFESLLTSIGQSKAH